LDVAAARLAPVVRIGEEVVRTIRNAHKIIPEFIKAGSAISADIVAGETVFGTLLACD